MLCRTYIFTWVFIKERISQSFSPFFFDGVVSSHIIIRGFNSVSFFTLVNHGKQPLTQIIFITTELPLENILFDIASKIPIELFFVLTRHRQKNHLYISKWRRKICIRDGRFKRRAREEKKMWKINRFSPRATFNRDSCQLTHAQIYIYDSWYSIFGSVIQVKSIRDPLSLF